ncbi:MAG: hypothetical protein RR189_00740 [Bacilli bacterium]
MNKKNANILLIVTIFSISILIGIIGNNYLKCDINVIKSNKEYQKSSNNLALMYEITPSSGEYQVSTDSVWPSTGYEFNSTLSKCENGSTLTYDMVNNEVKVQLKTSDKCFVYFDKEKPMPKFSEYLIANNGTIGMDHHTSTLANGANDNSYRFSGSDPNNYVCFGPGATTAGTACPEENQYRIIGVFGNQVKLIKKTILGKTSWNLGYMNTWAKSTLDVYLNGEYLNSLTPSWSDKISISSWQVGGMVDAIKNGIPSTAYSNEVGVDKANVTSNSKIGLMYVSDYGFAIPPNNWNFTLNNYDNGIEASNWLFLHLSEWTISVTSDVYGYAFSIYARGNIICGGTGYELSFRPSFYLQPLITVVGGNGTSNNPYRVS